MPTPKFVAALKFRLPGHNQDTSLRIFRSEIFDPADAVTIFQEWLDQKNVRLMLADQFSSVKEAMRAAANVIPLVAPNDCGHALFADTRVPHHYDPTQREDRASCRTFFHGYERFNKSAGTAAMV